MLIGLTLPLYAAARSSKPYSIFWDTLASLVCYTGNPPFFTKPIRLPHVRLHTLIARPIAQVFLQEAILFYI